MFTNTIYNHLRKTTPSVSETELTALRAGDSSIESYIFSGEINWDSILKIQHPNLTAEEASFIQNETRELCDMVNDHVINTELDDLPEEVWNFIKEKGFLGLQIKKEFGGKEFSPFAISNIVSLIASKSVVAAVTVMVPNSLGPAELLQHYGTDDQKSKYLPRLANGQEIPCFALTSPEAGSDATSIPDEGIIALGEWEGEEVLGIKLSWDKRYITLAPVATLIGLAFKARDPEGLIGDQVELGITCALIPHDLTGVYNNKRHLPCGLQFMNGPTNGQGVFIPLDFVVGGQEYIGQGWRMLVEQLSCGRGVSLPALGAASSAVSYKTSIQYANIRKQFGTEIINFEGILEPISTISANNLISESFRKLVLTTLNKGISPAILTAMAKYHLTEMSRENINAAMDIHGGKAIQCGTDNYLNYHYRGAPVAITVEGANILTRSLMIFGQGSVRCHPYLLKEFLSLKNPDAKEGKKAFKEVFYKHIKFSVSNYLKSQKYYWLGSPKVSGYKFSDIMSELNRLSTGYSFVTDVLLLTTGGDVKRKEHLSARLGDILSYLTLATSVLVDFENNKESEQYPELYRHALLTLLGKINETANQLYINAPNSVIKCWVRKFLKPKASFLNQHTDSFKKSVIKKLSGNEKSLTSLVHMNTNEDDGISIVHRAFEAKLNAKSVYISIRERIKQGDLPGQAPLTMNIRLAHEKEFINDDELKLIQTAESLIRQAVSVQSFQK